MNETLKGQEKESLDNNDVTKEELLQNSNEDSLGDSNLEESNTIEKNQKLNNGEQKPLIEKSKVDIIKEKLMSRNALILKIMGVVVLVVVAIVICINVSYYNKGIKLQKQIEQLITEKKFNEAHKNAQYMTNNFNRFGLKEKGKNKIEHLIKESNNAFLEGVKTLNKDSEDYKSSLNYFTSYISEYEFSDNSNNAKEIISIINEYNEKSAALSKAIALREYYDAAEKYMDLVKRYVSDVKAFHDKIDKGINGKDEEKMKEAMIDWKSNKDYYYRINKDVMTTTSRSVLNDNEINILRNYVVESLIPGEVAYNVLMYNKEDEESKKNVIESWSNSNKYEIQIFNIIENKDKEIKKGRDIIANYKKDLDNLKKKLNKYSDSI